MTDLCLHVKRKYFEQIKAGTKTVEYRQASPYWLKRLFDGSPFGRILIFDGYPPRSEYKERRIEFSNFGEIWETTITHDEFGSDPVKVIAIELLGTAP